jgi:hypothetical protein
MNMSGHIDFRPYWATRSNRRAVARSALKATYIRWQPATPGPTLRPKSAGPGPTPRTQCFQRLSPNFTSGAGASGLERWSLRLAQAQAGAAAAPLSRAANRGRRPASLPPHPAPSLHGRKGESSRRDTKIFKRRSPERRSSI